MLLSNVVMTSLFVKSLQQSGSVIAVTLNTATNFLLTVGAMTSTFHGSTTGFQQITIADALKHDEEYISYAIRMQFSR